MNQLAASLPPMMVLLLVFAVVLTFGLWDWQRNTTAATRPAGGVLLFLSFSLSMGLVYRVLEPGPVAATASLQVGAAPLAVEAGSGRALLVRAELPSPEAGESVSGKFHLTVLADGEKVLDHRGSFDEHWEAHRTGRKGAGTSLERMVHTEERIDLPSRADDRPLTLRLESEEGDLVGTPVEVSVVAALPSAGFVQIAGVALAVLAAVVDGRAKQRSHVVIPVSVAVALGALSLSALTPHVNGTAALGAALGAIFFGVPGGILLRWGVGPVAAGKPAAA